MLKLSKSLVLVIPFGFLSAGCEKLDSKPVRTTDIPCWSKKSGDFSIEGPILLSIRKYGHVRIRNEICGGGSVAVRLKPSDSETTKRIFEKNDEPRLFELIIPAYVEGKKTGDTINNNIRVIVNKIDVDETVKPIRLNHF